MQKCPSCACPYGYEVSENLHACPECAFEWNLDERSRKGRK